jgi:hypothetical protein
VTVLGDHTVTIVRPPALDPYGDPLPGAAVETTVSGCFVQSRGAGQPGASSELTDQRDTVITGMLVFMPSGTDVEPTDRVRWNGDLYAVEGEPDRWDDIRGNAHHIEVQLRRVEG